MNITSGSISLNVPQEIIDLIVDEILVFSNTQRNGGQLDALSIYSTICRPFLVSCRRHIFSSLRITTGKDYSGRDAFLAREPDIAGYVRRLSLFFDSMTAREELTPQHTKLHYLPVLTRILSRFSSVQSFSFGGMGVSMDWRIIHPLLQISVFDMLRCPTLTSLQIVTVRNFPVQYLSTSTGAKRLELLAVTTSKDEQFDICLPPTQTPSMLQSSPVTGFSNVTVSNSDSETWDRLSRGFLSLATLNVHYPSYPPYINLSSLHSLQTLNVCIWHTHMKNRETTLVALLRTAGEDPRGLRLRQLHVIINIYHKSGLPGACEGIDAVLSKPQYQNLREFSLHITYKKITPAEVLGTVGTEDLHAYYLQKMPNLDKRGVLSLKVGLGESGTTPQFSAIT